MRDDARRCTFTAAMSLTATMTIATAVRMSGVPMLPAMKSDPAESAMDLGASLRDRATLPSPLRGLVPSGGYPSRLHSLRSFRAALGRRLAALAAACPADTTCTTRSPCSTMAIASAPRSPAAPTSRAAPIRPLHGAGHDDDGHDRHHRPRAAHACRRFPRRSRRCRNRARLRDARHRRAWPCQRRRPS